jgi:thiol-disulfide isomerase/thioredoxin
MKAMLYVEVIGDPAKGAALIRQLKTEFPDTIPGKQADHLLLALQRQIDDAKIQAALSVGAKFPGFEETDLAGQPLSLKAYQGKVVLVDFWATWCGPCVSELPNVLAAYKKYHDKGFDIVGISLDQDKEKLTSFMKERGMSWAQYFDGKGWDNKLAVKYGVDSIPSTFLLDGDGMIIARDLRGPALEAALARRLSKP